MAVAFDAVTGAGPAVGTTHTMAHTCTGSALCLYVGVECDQEPGATFTATYNGVAMTQLAHDIDNTTGKVWRLVAPATGGANVVITTTNSVRCTIVAISFTGVHQTTPDDTVVIESEGDGSINVPNVVAGDIVVDFYLTQDTTEGFTAGAGQTLQKVQANVSGGRDVYCSTEAGTGSITMSWSSDVGATYHVGIRVLVNLDTTVTDTLDLAETLQVAIGVGFSDTLALAETLQRNWGIGLADALTLAESSVFPLALVLALTDTLTLTEFLGKWAVDRSPTTQTWVTDAAPAETAWTDEDPGGTPTWVADDPGGSPTWTMEESGFSSALGVMSCDSTVLSKMFCGRVLPFTIPTDCSAIAALLGTAGGNPRINNHGIEEVPDSSLIVGLVVASVTPHLGASIFETSAPYATATKQDLDTNTDVGLFGAMRIQPTTRTMVALYSRQPVSSTQMWVASVPFTSGAYNYAGKTLTALGSTFTGGDRSTGLVPLQDGRWLAMWAGPLGTLNWAYSETDGVTWGTVSTLVEADAITVKLGLAGSIPVIAYTKISPTGLKLRALNLTTNLWGSEVDPSLALSDDELFDVAGHLTDPTFGLFYLPSTGTIAKLKLYTVLPSGTITLVSTEDVYDVAPSALAGIAGTHHSLTGKWAALVSTTGNDTVLATRLTTSDAGSAWTTTAQATGLANYQIPAIPRCATRMPMQTWAAGNTVTLRRITV